MVSSGVHFNCVGCVEQDRAFIVNRKVIHEHFFGPPFVKGLGHFSKHGVHVVLAFELLEVDILQVGLERHRRLGRHAPSVAHARFFAVTMGAAFGAVKILQHFVGVGVSALDPFFVDLHTRLQGAAGFLKVAVLRIEDVVDVVQQVQRPRIFRVDLIFRGHFDDLRVSFNNGATAPGTLGARRATRASEGQTAAVRTRPSP